VGDYGRLKLCNESAQRPAIKQITDAEFVTALLGLRLQAHDTIALSDEQRRKITTRETTQTGDQRNR
jgi:hypothetical protein